MVILAEGEHRGVYADQLTLERVELESPLGQRWLPFRCVTVSVQYWESVRSGSSPKDQVHTKWDVFPCPWIQV